MIIVQLWRELKFIGINGVIFGMQKGEILPHGIFRELNLLKVEILIEMNNVSCLNIMKIYIYYFYTKLCSNTSMPFHFLDVNSAEISLILYIQI